MDKLVLNKSKSGLEGLMLKEKNSFKEGKKQVRVYQLLKNTMNELNWTDQDVYHLAAKYINDNIERDRREVTTFKYQMENIDMNNYQPKNYDENKFEKHKLSLSANQKEQLDFMIYLYAIKSPELIREFELKHGKRSEKKSWLSESIETNEKIVNDMPLQHYLVLDYIRSLTSRFHRPVNNSGYSGFRNCASKLFDHTAFVEKVRINSTKGVSLNTIVEDLLENYYYSIFNERNW